MILFDQANHRQTVRVDLGAGALWMGWEISRFGRSARGERFARGAWRSQTEVWQQGKLLWIDPQYVLGNSTMRTHPHGLGGYPVAASFVMLGQAVEPELMEQVRSLWQPTTSVMNPSPQAGATRLPCGLLCRYRGHSTTQARQWFTQVWHLLRGELCHLAPCHPRVWPIS
jgi:urease accessory protein